MKKSRYPEDIFSDDTDEVLPKDQTTPVIPVALPAPIALPVKYCPICNSIMTVLSRDDVVPDGIGVTSTVTFLYECPYCHYTE